MEAEETKTEMLTLNVVFNAALVTTKMIAARNAVHQTVNRSQIISYFDREGRQSKSITYSVGVLSSVNH